MSLSVEHIAGPLVEGVQRCSRCGEALSDYRNTMTVGAWEPRGFAEGPVFVTGQCTSVAPIGDDAMPCRP